jgi:predicted Zn finger-like uncharacterized protein
MPLAVQCPSCSAKFRAQEAHAGRVAKCPKCTQAFRLPAAAANGAGGAEKVAPTAAAVNVAARPAAQSVKQATSKPAAKPAKSLTRDQLAKQLLGGFTGPIKRTRTPISYQLSAIAVAAVMLLLPAVYVGLIALASYGVYWHAVNNTDMLSSEALGRGRQQAMVVMAYLAPIVGGPVMVLFMIKPLFARPERAQRIRFLNRDSEPLLFAFVDRVCETVGSPRPKRIDLDCQVNASASFRRGMLSMLGNDLVLTLGMPLVAGLNTRQLAGVLAHEFGHFAQGFGMRLTYLIRTINFWFMRVVYHRDKADAWLEQSAGSVDIRIGWVLYVAMACVWTSRKVLSALMHVGHFFGSHLLRQMEFDADRYEARLAGSEAFAQTVEKLHLLNYASEAALSDLSDFYREGRLGDDLPQLIQVRAANAPAELKHAIDARIAEGRTRWFDSHPCDADRVAAAKAEAAPGVFQIEMPATVLLTHFEAQSKATTLDFYRGIFGNKFDVKKLRPVSEIEAKQKKTRAGNEALERYFQGEWHGAAPLKLESFYLAAPKNANEALAELKRVREETLAKAKSLQGAAMRLYKAYEKAGEMQVRLSLVRSRAKIDKKVLKEWGGESVVKRGLDAAEGEIEKATANFSELNRLAARRLELGLSLLQAPKVAERVGRAVDSAGIDRTFEPLRILSEQLVRLASLQRLHAALGLMLQGLEAKGSPDDIVPVIQDLMRRIFPIVKGIRAALERANYPYEHAEGQMTLARFLVPDVPINDDLASIYNSCGQALENMPQLYVRVFGQMVDAAEAVEAACGMPRAEAPKALREGRCG